MRLQDEQVEGLAHNPYAPPRDGAQALPDAWSKQPRGRRPGRVYLAINLVYAALMLFGALALINRGKVFRFDVGNVMASACFLAPVACFVMVWWLDGRHWRKLAVVYGLFLLPFAALVAFALVFWPDIPAGVAVIFAINLAACVSGIWQMRRAQNP